MLNKVYNENGQKAYQRTDNEDRSLVYRNWLRTVDTDGFFIDIDFIKWRVRDGAKVPVAITDLTRCDSETAGEAYRNAITDRLFKRDSQGELLQTLGDLLKIPVYLVLFQKDMKWLWVYSFQRKEWKEFTPDAWVKYLKNL